MQTLAERGYAGTTWVIEPRVRKLLHNTAKRALTNRRQTEYATNRVGYPINPSEISVIQWRAILPAEQLQLLRDYLGGDPELLLVETIEVPPNTPRQKVHRDQSSGARKAVCVAVNLEKGKDVGTLFFTGSHLINGDASETNPVRPSRGDWIIYDTYCIHAGSSNPTNRSIDGRLFFTFRAPASKLSTQEKRHLTRGLAPRARRLHPPIPLSSLLSGVLCS